MGVTSLVVGVGIWMIFRNNLPPYIPMFYSRPWGEDQLTASWGILIVPVLNALIGILALGIDRVVKDSALVNISQAAMLVSQIIMILGWLKILWVAV